MSINWVHLDFKGVMPGHRRLCQWVDWLADRGVGGLVLEYEDRLPWRTWPGTHRPGLSVAQWQSVIATARRRGMEVVPLIQTHGHLEWLLKHSQWASWRENGCWNEICPQIKSIRPAMRAWIDEIIAIHGELQYLHIGGDETWNLATCPRCKAIAESSPDGKLHVYLTHLHGMVEEVVSRGVRPLIWADAFWREKRLDLVAKLPPQVMLCDWQYTGSGPWQTVEELGRFGHTVIGSSSARPSCDPAECIDEQLPHVANIRGWQRHAGTIGTIHTMWGRMRSLLPCFGPWEGWLPGLLAAGEPDGWTGHELEPWAGRLDAALRSPITAAKELAEELDRVKFDDPMSDGCRAWWALALRWRFILDVATGNARMFAALESVNAAVQVDPDYINHRRAAHGRMVEEMGKWETDVRAYFAEREISDVEEFVTSRMNLVRAVMREDWAAGLVAVGKPRTAR